MQVGTGVKSGEKGQIEWWAS